MTPHFELQLHEIARTFALVAPAPAAGSVTWNGRTFDYALGRLDHGNSGYTGVWLRERGGENAGHWIVASVNPPFAPYDVGTQKVRKVPPSIIAALENRDGLTLACFVASPRETGPDYALLLPEGRGCWFWLGRTVTFDFAPDAAIARSSRAAFAWLQSALKDDESSVAFAWRWIKMIHGDKVRALYGDSEWIAEIETAMKKVLQCAPELWEWLGPLHWEVGDGNARQRFMGDWPPSALTSPFFRAWADWVRAQCHARRRDDWFERYRCISDYGEGNWLCLEAALDAQPSFHQRLESQLELRSWLQERATPAEIAALLPS